MAKPGLTPTSSCARGKISAGSHPWLAAYPKNIDWGMEFEPALVTSLLDAAVAAYGSRPCTYFMGKRLSFAEIGQLSDRAAKGLEALGVREGVKVGLLMPNCPAFVVFYNGILKAGGTVVNFNPLYSQEEIEAQARDSGTKIIVTLDLAATFDKVEALLASGALDKAVVASFTALLPKLKAVGMKFRGPKLAHFASSPQKTKIVAEQDLLANDGAYRKPAIGTDAIAVLQYTGGTTGTPKGAMLTHANLSINVKQVTAWWNQSAKAGDRVLGVLPLFHVFAMTTVMNFGVSQGMEMILLPRFDLIETLKLIAKLKPRMMPGVPTLYNAMMQHPHVRNFDLTSLEFCISGGAGLPIEVKRGFEAISGCKLTEGYGLSETSPVAACNPHDRLPKEGSIGLPLPGTEFSIRSLEDPSVEVERGEAGEICIAGPQVMAGYWNKPEETENAFVSRFFRTGDVGYMDEEGFTFIVDRIKDMINASGFKVYPRRIEDVLYEHAAVEEVTVIGIPDAYRGEAPKAFVKLKEGERATQAELLEFMRPRLSKIELPAEIEFRDSLPKTMVGKHSKKELRAEGRRKADQSS
ncbi:MAG TPA: long-chain fatty acid--CoA ligase [Methyloceanibacter sp.]|jgi:long-chain acyl-CoA synthetase|nr:long-chain fatty acid--CoA ligase [Methyloceanibacter sp.]